MTVNVYSLGLKTDYNSGFRFLLLSPKYSFLLILLLHSSSELGEHLFLAGVHFLGPGAASLFMSSPSETLMGAHECVFIK